MTRKILITGGCGFIGVNLVEALLSSTNAVIRIVDDLSVGSPADHPLVSSFELVEDLEKLSDTKNQVVVASILSSKLIEKIVSGFDTIVHLAANTGVQLSLTNPKMDFQINAFGTFNLLEGARKCGVKQFIFASSGAVLGEVVPPMHEDMPTRTHKSIWCHQTC